jgi:hypothetical protein
VKPHRMAILQGENWIEGHPILSELYVRYCCYENISCGSFPVPVTFWGMW